MEVALHREEKKQLSSLETVEMEDDEALIEAVRGFECLWKVKSKGYKDLRAKENARKVVAEKVPASVIIQHTLCYTDSATRRAIVMVVFFTRLKTQTQKIAKDNGRASGTNMYVNLRR